MSKLPGMATRTMERGGSGAGPTDDRAARLRPGAATPTEPGWLGVRGLEHLGHGSGHAERSSGRFEAFDPHVRDLVAHELGRDLGGSVGRLSISADSDREHPSLSGPV